MLPQAWRGCTRAGWVGARKNDILSSACRLNCIFVDSTANLSAWVHFCRFECIELLPAVATTPRVSPVRVLLCLPWNTNWYLLSNIICWVQKTKVWIGDFLGQCSLVLKVESLLSFISVQRCLDWYFPGDRSEQKQWLERVFSIKFTYIRENNPPMKRY